MFYHTVVAYSYKCVLYYRLFYDININQKNKYKMDLKEKFENVEIMFEGKLGILKYDELCEAPNECVKIAKDFANNKIEKICYSDNLDKIIHSKSYDDARRIIKILIQQ